MNRPCPNCDGPCIPTCILSKRTLEDLLAERRMLAGRTSVAAVEAVANIDHELDIRRRDALPA